jgi:hypothetical protein
MDFKREKFKSIDQKAYSGVELSDERGRMSSPNPIETQKTDRRPVTTRPDSPTISRTEITNR